MTCPVCGEAVRADARACPHCGEPLEAPRRRGPADGADSTGGVIPYNNAPALIAYYLGLFSLFPLLGLPLGVAALVLGVLGLKKRRENPAVKGSAHAWIGIGCGTITTLAWAATAIAIVVALVRG